MKLALKAATALLATTAIAQAGGVERSNQSMAILFEEGTYAELSFSVVSPDVSGVQDLPLGAGAGTPSGDMTNSYVSYALRYRQDLGGPWSFGFIAEDHIGASVDYPTATGYFIGGSNAALDGDSFTALLRYEMPTGFSLYGGARISRVSGEVELVNPLLPGGVYTLDTDNDTAVGYVLGVAYEVPEIALRVNLTYNSAYTQTLAGTETNGAFGTITNDFDVEIPQSLHLEAQSGIAEDTLLFGSIRWVDWTEFTIAPVGYTVTLGQDPLVDYDSDVVTYQIGVGRRFSDEFSGAFSITYEPENNDIPTGNLGPTDGRIGLGIGGSYTTPSGVEVSGGVSYSFLGNTRTTVGTFEDNTVIGAGVTLGMSF